MPFKDNYGNKYKVVSRGINEKGNVWTKKDFGPGHVNDNTYRYDNRDGDYFYDNPDGSRYWNNKAGTEIYWPPGNDGSKWIREGGEGMGWRKVVEPQYGRGGNHNSGNTQRAAHHNEHIGSSGRSGNLRTTERESQEETHSVGRGHELRNWQHERDYEGGIAGKEDYGGWIYTQQEDRNDGQENFGMRNQSSGETRHEQHTRSSGRYSEPRNDHYGRDSKEKLDGNVAQVGWIHAQPFQNGDRGVKGFNHPHGQVEVGEEYYARAGYMESREPRVVEARCPQEPQPRNHGRSEYYGYGEYRESGESGALVTGNQQQQVETHNYGRHEYYTHGYFHGGGGTGDVKQEGPKQQGYAGGEVYSGSSPLENLVNEIIGQCNFRQPTEEDYKKLEDDFVASMAGLHFEPIHATVSSEEEGCANLEYPQVDQSSSEEEGAADSSDEEDSGDDGDEDTGDYEDDYASAEDGYEDDDYYEDDSDDSY